MTLQLNICANPEVDKLLLKHNNRPMNALYEALQDTANQGIELPMAIIMDRRCGIERRVEEDDGLNWDGAAPLMLAIRAGRLDVAQALLAAGADPNTKTSDGCNCLMVAAHTGGVEGVELLISYGADVNAVDIWGRTPLHVATRCRNANVIGPLEQSGANLEAVDDNEGQTPLHEAALASDAGSIEVLLKLGANQAAVDIDGRTPLHRAASITFASVKTIESFRCNVAAFKANLTTVDRYGQKPIQVYGSRPRGPYNDSKVCALLAPK